MWKARERNRRDCVETIEPSTYRSIIEDTIALPQCRALIHQLQAVLNDGTIRSILLLSHGSGAGKTFLTSVVAEAALKLLGKRVLVVDLTSASLAESHYSKCFRSSLPDADERLSQQGGEMEVVIAKRINDPNSSDFKGHGKKSPIESLSDVVPSDFEVGAYLSTIRNRYDLTLIDGCSLQGVNRDTLHPSILSSHSDASIMVIPPSGMERSALASVKSLLAHYRIRPSGFVFNQGGY